MRSIFLLTFTLLTACSDDLPDATKIIDERMVGAGVEVTGDEARTTPRPGEDFDLKWHFMSPEQLGFSYAIILCESAASRSTVPYCASAPLALQSDINLADRDLSFATHWQAPNDFPASSKLLALAAFCYEGPVNTMLDATNPHACADPNQYGTLVTMTVSMQRDENSVGNSAPEIADMKIDDIEWLPASDDADCSDSAGLRRFSRSQESVTILITDADKRETYINQFGESQIESYQMSLYTTHGITSPRFAFLEGDATEKEITWELNEVDASRLPAKVQFALTIRDGRGGFTILRRAACLDL